MQVDYLDTLRRLCPNGNAAIIAGTAAAMPKYLPAAQIVQPLRLPHFLAQVAHESAGFRTLTEYASGAAYNGRRDLGNTQPGDGPRYKGRGMIQLTGRANYRLVGSRIGIDLENNPLKAADPDVSVQTACDFWKMRGLNAYADRDDVNGITKRINGGYNGLAMRVAFLKKAKALLAGKTDVQVHSELIEAKKASETKRNASGAVAGAAPAAGGPSAIAVDPTWDWATLAYFGIGIAAVGLLIYFAYRAYKHQQQAKAFAAVAD